LNIGSHQTVNIVDEDGDPVVFDPKTLPEGEKLFLQVDGIVLQQPQEQ
jgi:hypothetical protein